MSEKPQPLPPDDMIDAPADFQRWPFLLHVLGECRDLLVSVYLNSDRGALAAQRVHGAWVKLAAFFATLAVCLAILQLAGLRAFLPKSMPIIEGIAVLSAALAFRRGEKSREKWLTERHKAERCRLLKFSSMIRPDIWDMNEPPLEQYTTELANQINGVKAMAFDGAKKWLDEDNLPSPPGRFFPRDLKDLTDLRDYYREKRLRFQAGYFKQQSERDVHRDEWWRGLPHRLFTASVVIVALHVIIEWTGHLADKLHLVATGIQSVPWVEVLLDAAIAFAALLPVIGSGIRTWRSAHEATRNISRFRAKHIALSNIEHRLIGNQIADYAEAESVLRDLWCAEQIMESEHREWLRLMLEAEWLG